MDIVTEFTGLISSGAGITASLLGVAVLMILRGALVPSKIVEDIKAAKNEWQSAWREERKMRQEVEAALAELVRQGQTTMHFIDSLPDPKNTTIAPVEEDTK